MVMWSENEGNFLLNLQFFLVHFSVAVVYTIVIHGKIIFLILV